MNAAELAEYCRKKGLYKEQIEAWRDVCLNANSREFNQTKKQLNPELIEEKNRVKTLEKHFLNIWLNKSSFVPNLIEIYAFYLFSYLLNV
ncbi:hypothetical protein [Bacillus xiapuensis]|uniref:hypothetical protein n=1 Tax=Bacillus xiapuensis TaxID=2014075 RepID=UPI0018E2354E|nr:hypothetical protein [Bacillus xiapuensis]